MNKKIKFLLIFLFSISLTLDFNSVYAAGSTDSSNDKVSLYKAGKKLVYRAKKLEAKNKKEKAQKLYIKAYSKFEQAYSKNKKNADILNYLGFTLRKTGKLEEAEIYYLKGLEIDAGHLGINEYLGELYVQTNRIDLAKERLNILQGCNCEEYEDLKKLIKNK